MLYKGNITPAGATACGEQSVTEAERLWINFFSSLPSVVYGSIIIYCYDTVKVADFFCIYVFAKLKTRTSNIYKKPVRTFPIHLSISYLRLFSSVKKLRTPTFHCQWMEPAVRFRWSTCIITCTGGHTFATHYAALESRGCSLRFAPCFTLPGCLHHPVCGKREVRWRGSIM